MNRYDYLVLFGSVLAIAVYGMVRTRGRRNLHDYLRGKRQTWFAIGLSVMATQASAVTFLSTPGQGYMSGMSFVQHYLSMPLALLIIAAFFLPIYRKLNVYTAYEYLGNRFDRKTRLLGASLFLLQRGMGAGITIFAPAIVLSTVFGWSLPLTVLASGLVVIVYTVAGGSDAVTHTQKYQMGIIFAGMVAAFFILLAKLPCSMSEALTLAGQFDKTQSIDFSFDPARRYTVWSSLFGSIFLFLAYFGTDQSQVQRYISGDNLRESRLGLMFNAVLKVPMQFGILLLGVMLFAFYLFHPAPAFFNRVALERHRYAGTVDPGQESLTPSQLITVKSAQLERAAQQRDAAVKRWLLARDVADGAAEARALEETLAQSREIEGYRAQIRAALKTADPRLNTNDADFVFITFILDHLPNGLIGLLVASFFAAALSSISAELNALASTSAIDFYRHLIRPPSAAIATQGAPDSSGPSDRHYVMVSRLFTVLWGGVAIAFALFAYMSENLIQAVNIVGSVFYGTVLGMFLIAFFIKFVRGTAAFWGALAAQAVVFGFFAANTWGYLNISFLWYNLIGCGTAIVFAMVLQLMIGTPGSTLGTFVARPDPAGRCLRPPEARPGV